MQAAFEPPDFGVTYDAEVFVLATVYPNQTRCRLRQFREFLRQLMVDGDGSFQEVHSMRDRLKSTVSILVRNVHHRRCERCDAIRLHLCRPDLDQPIPSANTTGRAGITNRAPALLSTERIEHKSAADGRIKASPMPLHRRNFANMRGIFYLSAENTKIVDWVAERGGFEPSSPLQSAGHS
jgi:hypothetical protein